MASPLKLKHSQDQIDYEAVAGLIDCLKLTAGVEVPPPSLGTVLLLSLIDSPLMRFGDEGAEATLDDLVKALYCICNGKEAMHKLQTVKRLKAMKAEQYEIEQAYKEFDDAVIEFAQSIRPDVNYEAMFANLLMYFAACFQPLEMISESEDSKEDPAAELKKK